MPRPARATLVLALLAPLSSAQVVPGFHAPGIAGDVHCSAVHDDGSGSRLYLGGFFRSAGELGVRSVVRWDGHEFELAGKVPPKLAQPGVMDLCEFDDGNGPRLYAAGDGGVYVLNGDSWSLFAQTGGGFNNGCKALEAVELGGKRYLAAGGGFSSIGGLPATGIALWDGTSWSGLGPVQGAVYELAALQRSGKDELFVGGLFQGSTFNQKWALLRWDGSQWLNVPVSHPTYNPIGATTIAALEVIEGPAGPVLYAGGGFSAIDGVTAHGLACYDGVDWSPVGTGPGVELGEATPGLVTSLSAYASPGASGPVLVVGGNFDRVDGQPAESLALWKDGAWSTPLPGLGGEASCIAAWEPPGGAGPELLAFGSFGSAGGQPGGGGTRWDGTHWSQLTDGLGMGGAVYDMVWFAEGSGEELLFAGGDFTFAGQSAARAVARWDGERWSEVGSGLDGEVATLRVLDMGTGPALYAGSGHKLSLDHGHGAILRWDGTSWTNIAPDVFGWIEDLAVFDGGAGPELYAAGVQGLNGQLSDPWIARWDGSAWHTVGGGLDDQALTLEVYDGAPEPVLVVGGRFKFAGGLYLPGLACWNGSEWTGLKDFPFEPDLSVEDIVVLNAPSNPTLVLECAGLLGGLLWHWDGTTLEPMGSGSGKLAHFPECMGLGPGPGNPDLYAVSGPHPSVGPNQLARWRGSSWVSLLDLEAAYSLAPGGRLSSGLFLGLRSSQVFDGVRAGGFAQYELGCDQLGTFCDLEPTAASCPPTVSVQGAPSVGSGEPLLFLCHDNEVMTQGVVLYGIHGIQPAFGTTSGPCIAPPVRSVPMRPLPHDPLSSCPLDLELDFNEWIRSGNDPALVAGQTVHAQVAVKSDSTVTYLTAHEMTICP